VPPPTTTATTTRARTPECIPIDAERRLHVPPPSSPICLSLSPSLSLSLARSLALPRHSTRAPPLPDLSLARACYLSRSLALALSRYLATDARALAAK
jgi:hypothetical protein